MGEDEEKGRGEEEKRRMPPMKISPRPGVPAVNFLLKCGGV
jgi:hypothetical protein